MENMPISIEKENQNYLRWCEGNKYLYDLLCSCGKNNITTFASCGGHEDWYNRPYLGIIIDTNSLPFIKSMLSQLQDMENITIISSARHSGDKKLFEDAELRGLIFYAHNYNCCEMFYKMKKGIESKDNKVELNIHMRRFYDSIERLNQTSRTKLQDDIDNEIVIGSTISSDTQELIDYENSRKLIRNSKFLRFFRKLLPFQKAREKRYEELEQKYNFLQKEYIEDKVKKLHQYKIENVDSERIQINDKQLKNEELLDKQSRESGLER